MLEISDSNQQGLYRSKSRGKTGNENQGGTAMAGIAWSGMRNLVLNLRSCHRKAKNIRKERTVAWTKGSRKKNYLFNERRSANATTRFVRMHAYFGCFVWDFRCLAMQILTSNECLLLFFFPFLFPPSKPYSTIPFWCPKVKASSFFSLLRRGQQTYMHLVTFFWFP